MAATVGRLNIFMNADLSGLEKGLKRAERSLNKAGRSLRRNLTAPLAAVAGSIALATHRTAEYADEIDKASIRSGIARGDLQRLKFAGDQLGVSFEGISGIVEAFTRRLPQIEKGTSDTAKAFRQLGVDLRTPDGELRSMGDLFPEIVGQLSKMENATERNAIATQIFGRRAFQIVPILEAGGDELARLMARADELGIVMGDDSVAAFVQFKDSVSAIRDALAGATRHIAAAFLPLLQGSLVPFIERRLVPAFRRFGDFLHNLEPGTLKLAVALGAVVAALGPVVMFAGTLAGMAASLFSVVGAVAAVGAGVLAVRGNVFGLGDAWDQVASYLQETVAPAFAAMADPLKSFVNFAIGSFVSLGAVVWEFVKIAGEGWAELFRYVRELIKKESGFFGRWLEGIAKGLRAVAFEIGQLTSGLADSEDPQIAVMGDYGKRLADAALSGYGTDYVGGILKISKKGVEKIKSFLAEEGSESMRQGGEAMGGAFNEGLKGMEKPVVKKLTDMQRMAGSVFDRMTDAVVDFASGAKDAFRDFAAYAMRQLALVAARMAAIAALSALIPGFGAANAAGAAGFLTGALGIETRHTGGPVSAGTPYIWKPDEELFVPSQSGMVIPNNELEGSGGGVPTFDFSNFPAARSPFESVRDHVWQDYLTKSLDERKRQGYDFGGGDR